MIYSGSLVSLSLKDNQRWLIIGGMRITKVFCENSVIEANNLNNNWRVLLDKAGLRHIDITVAGMFSNSEAEQKITSLALIGEISEYKISFANKESLVGNFLISSYERIGNVGEEENYSISFTSSGEILQKS